MSAQRRFFGLAAVIMVLAAGVSAAASRPQRGQTTPSGTSAWALYSRRKYAIYSTLCPLIP